MDGVVGIDGVEGVRRDGALRDLIHEHVLDDVARGGVRHDVEGDVVVTHHIDVTRRQDGAAGACGRDDGVCLRGDGLQGEREADPVAALAVRRVAYGHHAAHILLFRHDVRNEVRGLVADHGGPLRRAVELVFEHPPALAAAGIPGHRCLGVRHVGLHEHTVRRGTAGQKADVGLVLINSRMCSRNII